MENIENLYSKKRFGILDWGVGGLGFYNLFKESHPKVPVLYFSDAGALPYGKMDQKDLTNRVQNILHFMVSAGCDKICIACHSASTVVPYIQKIGVPVTNIIDHTIRMLQNFPPSLILGGRGTILSGMYNLKNRNDILRIAQPLSAFVESGELESDKVKKQIKQIVYLDRGQKEIGIHNIILACTHYVALSAQISEIVGPEYHIIDPVEFMLKWVERNWPLEYDSLPDIFFTTGSKESFLRSSKAAFGVNVHRNDVIHAGELVAPSLDSSRSQTKNNSPGNTAKNLQ